MVDARSPQGLGRLADAAQRSCSSSSASGISRRGWPGRRPSTRGWPALPTAFPRARLLDRRPEHAACRCRLRRWSKPSSRSSPLRSPELELAAIEPEILAGRAKKPSGGGGAPNKNPGAGDGDGFGLARFGDGGEVIRGVPGQGRRPSIHPDLEHRRRRPRPARPRARRQGDLLGRAQGQARAASSTSTTPRAIGPENVYWLVESDGPGSEKVKGPGPTGHLQVVRRLLGRLRRHRQADPLAGPRQARRQGRRPSRQVQSLNERSKIYTLKVDRPGARRPARAAPREPAELNNVTVRVNTH